MPSIDRRAGYTLIEMVAVMAIVALVASLIITATPGTGRAGLKAVTLQIAALFRRERMRAIVNRDATGVALDGERRLLIGDGGEALALPKDVTIDLLGAGAGASDQLAIVRFEPDGESSGAVLRLSREQAGYEIRVNWYTGGVAVSAAEGPQSDSASD
jgi:general secretion pathway protein H